MLSIFTYLSSEVDSYSGGISGSGGGNSINHKLVEEYVFEPGTGDAGTIFQERLAFLKREFPTLGEKLTNSYEKLTFYSVPKKLLDLSVEKTGLHFENDQLAIHNDGEVFVNGELFEKLSAEGKAKFLLHEGLMSLMAEKQSRDVRKVVAEVFNKNTNPLRLQKKFMEGHFGIQLTKSDLEVLKKSSNEKYIDGVSGFLSTILVSCRNNLGFDKLMEKIREEPISNPKFGYLNRKLHNPFLVQDTVNLYSSKISYGFEFETSSDANDDIKILWSKIFFGDKHPRKINTELLAEISKLHPDKGTKLNAPEAELRLLMGRFNAGAAQSAESDGRWEIIDNLSSNPSFVNILALSGLVKNTFDMSPIKEELSDPRIETNYGKRILLPAHRRSKEVSQFSEKEKRNLLCNSVESLTSKLGSESQPSGKQDALAPSAEPKSGEALEVK